MDYFRGDYLRDFDSGQKTKNDPRGGAEPKLTEEQSGSLLKHLSEITCLKVQHIRAYVKENYGATYSRSGMTKWLQDLRSQNHRASAAWNQYRRAVLIFCRRFDEVAKHFALSDR